MAAHSTHRSLRSTKQPEILYNFLLTEHNQQGLKTSDTLQPVLKQLNCNYPPSFPHSTCWWLMQKRQQWRQMTIAKCAVRTAWVARCYTGQLFHTCSQWEAGSPRHTGVSSWAGWRRRCVRWQCSTSNIHCLHTQTNRQCSTSSIHCLHTQTNRQCTSKHKSWNRTLAELGAGAGLRDEAFDDVYRHLKTAQPGTTFRNEQEKRGRHFSTCLIDCFC